MSFSDPKAEARFAFSMKGPYRRSRRVYRRYREEQRARQEGRELDPLTLPSSVIREYSHHKSMWLAIALHDRFGWPIEGALSDHPMYRDDPWLDRAFVRMTDGHALDIAGIDGPQDLSTGELLSIPVTREFLLEKLGGEDPLKEAEAIQIIDKWIVPCYLTTILDLTKEP